MFNSYDQAGIHRSVCQ